MLSMWEEGSYIADKEGCHRIGVRQKYGKGGSGILRRLDIFENIKAHFLLTFRQSQLEVRVRQSQGEGGLT